MKKLGNVIFVIGWTLFVLGASGYDSNPAAAFLIALVGLALAWAGYRMDGEYVDYDKEK